MRARTVALVLGVFAASPVPAQSRPLFNKDSVEHLVSLSSPGFEAKPDISGDKLTLYYASDQAGGSGDLDLWVAHIVGISSYWQVIMWWDLFGQGSFVGIPYSSSPGLQVTFFQ